MRGGMPPLRQAVPSDGVAAVVCRQNAAQHGACIKTLQVAMIAELVIDRTPFGFNGCDGIAAIRGPSHGFARSQAPHASR